MINIKKIISFLLILSVICSLFTVLNISTTATGDNLLKNGDFENGSNNWILDEKATVFVDSNVAHGGSGFFNINQNFYSKNYQEITLLENTEYYYSFWYRVTSPAESVEWNFKIDKINSTKIKLPDTKDKWVKYSGSFNSGTITDTKFIFENNGEHGKFFIDDCVLKVQEQENPNLIANNDFENDFDGWIVHPSCSEWQIGIEDKNNSCIFYTGKKTLRIRHQWTNIRQENISLEENTDYVFSFYAKRVNVGNSSLDITVESLSNTVLAKISPVASSEFEKYSIVFNSGSNKTVKLYVRGNNGNGETYSYFDEFCIKKFNDNNLIVNGGFEGGSSGWTIHSTATVSSDNSIAHSGNNFFNINHNFYSKSYQTIAVEPGIDYEYSFWYRVTNPAASVEWNFKIKGIEGSEVKLSDTGDKWLHYNGSFNSGSLSEIQFIFENNGEHGKFFIDDCFLSPITDEVEELVKNGGFENGVKNWTVQNGENEWNVKLESMTSNVMQGGSCSLLIRHFWSHTYQNIEVEKNKNYDLTFYCKRKGSNSETSFIVKGLVDNTNIGEIKLTDDSEDFKKYSLTFNSGNNAFVRLAIQSNGGDANTYTYFDNISLKKSAGGNLLINGGFEDGETGWILHSSVKITENSDLAHSGNKFFNINQNFYSKSYQTVALESNTDYYYCFWYKVKNPATSVEWNFKLKNLEATQFKLEDTANKWLKHSGTFNSGELTETQFIIENNGEHGEFFIDDCVIVLKSESAPYEQETPEEPEEPGGDEPQPGEHDDEIVFGGNLLSNGGFEDGFNTWTVNKTNSWAADVVSNVHNEGNNCLQLKHTWIKITQTVSVNKNSDYELTFFSKRVSGDSDTSVRIYGVEGTNKTVIENRSVDESTSFVKNTIPFNSGKYNSIMVWIESNNGTAKTLTYLDDFVLAKVESDDALFFSKEASIIQGTTDDSSFVIKFKNATSKNSSSNIYYSVYCSEEIIDSSNINSLDAIMTGITNNEKLGNKVSGLKENTGYYIAIKAEDENSNAAYLRSGVKFTTMSSKQMANIVECGKNIISDGSFESGKFYDDTASDKDKTPYFWHNYGGINKDDNHYNATFNEEQAYSGKKCLRTYPWTFQVRQIVDVKTHTDYSLSYKAFSYKDGASITVYGVNTNGLITEIKAQQTFDFQRFEGTFNSGENSQLMICVTNNVSGCHIAFIDDIIMVEVENPDLYVAGDVVKIDEGDDYMTVGWDPVNTTSQLKDITYTLYMSDSKITKDDIDKLTKLTSFSGDSETFFYDVWDIVHEKGYYFAVVASDKLGNLAYMFSDGALSIPVPEEDEDDDEDEDDYFEDSDYDDSDEEYEGKTKFITVNKPKYVKKVKKIYHLIRMSTTDIIILVSSICAGVVAVAIAVLIFLKKKGILRRKKDEK